jgi:hydrogenase nickel incorporation protein HypB
MCTTCGCGPKELSDHAHDHDGHEHSHHSHDDGHTHGPAHDHTQGHHSHKDSTRTVITIEEDILAKNNRLAAFNRALFKDRGIFVLNLVSSPGSGKTTLLERTLRDLSTTYRFSVIEGDQQTDNDARRIAATGVAVCQINTGAGCHLDAHQVMHGTESFDLDNLDVLMIENVGNLVCPASFDLGEHHKVTVLSTTEGEDKPLKYPQMFRNSTVMLLNKIDLLPYLDFDVEKCKEYARRVNPAIIIFELSARTGEGMDAWYRWLGEGGAR